MVNRFQYSASRHKCCVSIHHATNTPYCNRKVSSQKQAAHRCGLRLDNLKHSVLCAQWTCFQSRFFCAHHSERKAQQEKYLVNLVFLRCTSFATNSACSGKDDVREDESRPHNPFYDFPIIRGESASRSIRHVCVVKWRTGLHVPLSPLGSL